MTPSAQPRGTLAPLVDAIEMLARSTANTCALAILALIVSFAALIIAAIR